VPWAEGSALATEAGHAALRVVDQSEDVAVRVIDGDEAPRRDVERLLVEREALGGALGVGGVDILDLEPDAGAAAAGAGRSRARG
jgi:hypothetical protein